MNQNQLLYFITTAHELHFAKSAEKLGITQSALSRGIQALEKELNASLFSRNNKWHVELTAPGKIFLPEAVKMLHHFNFAVNRVHAAGEGRYGKLSIGAISSTLGQKIFIETLAEMGRTLEGVAIEVIDSNSAELAQQMQERALDVAFFRTMQDIESDEELHCEKIYDDSLSIVLPRQHPLAKQKELQVADLARSHFILVPMRSSPAFRSYISGFLSTHGGFMPMLSGEISSSYTALRLVEAGLGVSIVSSAYAGLFCERLVFRQFSDATMSMPVSAVYTEANDSIPLHRLLSILKKRFAKTVALLTIHKP